jgi:oligoendopeptidase F
VSLFGTAPRRVFEDQDGFVTLTRKLFAAVDPIFDAEFDVLVRNGMLDLMSRPGKAPGGYNAMVEDIRIPFIFYNAVGRRGDLRVLLHEGGHAFHSLAAREIPVLDYRHAPTEFCEVASMSMELLGLERLEQVLGAEEAREIAYPHISGMISGLVSIARIDAFQHWMYTHPDHSAKQRADTWLELSDRFSLGFDQSGVEQYRPNGWQRVMHFFTHPLYYIEYGIATLGAWQLWRLERQDHDKAVSGYRKALSLGGSRHLPELFEAANIRFAMDQAIFEDLMPFVEERLATYAP